MGFIVDMRFMVYIFFRIIFSPDGIQLIVGLTTLLMVIRFGLDALRHRSRSNAMKVILLSLDAATYSMTIYSLGIMQRPSATNSYYQVWAVLLVTLRYSVKIGRPAGIAMKQTPLVDLMSSFWAANILRSQAMMILKAPVWLLWSVNSARIIHGFVSSEHANNRHKENMRLLTDFMRHEHTVGARGQRPDPSTMAGYRYLVSGEDKKRKQKAAEQVVRDEVEATENIKRLLLALREDDKELITLEKIWNHQGSAHNGCLCRCSDVFDEELKDLCLSFALYKLLRRRFFNFDIHEANLEKTRRLVLDGILGGNRGESGNSERAFRVSEAEVAFLNDFFNSRHAIIFAEGFPFLRLLLSTLLIGGISGMAVAIHSFSKVAKQDELGRVHHGVIFTWILLSLLGAKEIWEIITYVFSDWTKVLLLCKYVEQPWWLRGRVAMSVVRKLCRCPLFKRWHGKVGQLNLLFSTFWRWRRAPFLVDLSPEVKHAVIDSLSSLRNRPLDSYLDWAFTQADATDELRANVNGAVNGLQDDVHILLVWHIATCYCELASRNVRESIWSRGRAFRRRNPSDEDALWSHYMTATTLSQYCANVLTLVPPLLPGNSLMARAVFREVYREKNRLLFGRHKLLDQHRPLDRCTSSIQILERLEGYASGKIMLGNEEGNTILKRGAELGVKLTEATSGGTEALWKFLSEFWVGFVLYLAASTKAYQHKIFLSTGGELMTHLWALLSHAGYLGAAEHGDQAVDTVFAPIRVYNRPVQF